MALPPVVFSYRNIDNVFKMPPPCLLGNSEVFIRIDNRDYSVNSQGDVSKRFGSLSWLSRIVAHIVSLIHGEEKILASSVPVWKRECQLVRSSTESLQHLRTLLDDATNCAVAERNPIITKKANDHLQYLIGIAGSHIKQAASTLNDVQNDPNASRRQATFQRVQQTIQFAELIVNKIKFDVDVARQIIELVALFQAKFTACADAIHSSRNQNLATRYAIVNNPKTLEENFGPLMEKLMCSFGDESVIINISEQMQTVVDLVNSSLAKNPYNPSTSLIYHLHEFVTNEVKVPQRFELAPEADLLKALHKQCQDRVFQSKLIGLLAIFNRAQEVQRDLIRKIEMVNVVDKISDLMLRAEVILNQPSVKAIRDSMNSQYGSNKKDCKYSPQQQQLFAQLINLYNNNIKYTHYSSDLVFFDSNENICRSDRLLPDLVKYKDELENVVSNAESIKKPPRLLAERFEYLKTSVQIRHSKIDQLKNNLSEVRKAMQLNLDNTVLRGINLDEGTSKAEALEVSASTFLNNARKLND